MRRFAQSWALGLAALAAAAAAGPSRAAVPLVGGYYGNPNGNDKGAEQAFEVQFDSFVSVMGGAGPQVMNAFVDFSQPPANWPGNAGWTAWSWSQSAVVGTGIVPILGIPMSDNAHWAGNAPGSTNDDFFRSIAGGSYDSAYRGVLDAWVAAGFHRLYLRLGWEMDGSFMPWFMGSTPAVQADWVAAFRHLSDLFRNEAALRGATVAIVWNPDDIDWTALPVNGAYPGDAYVDVISSDAYSSLYPSGLYDWSLNNGTVDANMQQWMASATNRRHFWSFPSATQWNPHGTGIGWGLADTIAMARAHHKPIAISESGAGGNGTTTGPVDDPAFPYWLVQMLRLAQSASVPVAYVSIWDATLGDGNWDFSSTGAQKPLEAAAWNQYFGARAALRK